MIDLCQAFGTEFELLRLHSELFLHGYEKKYSESQIAIGILELPITDIKGIKANIPFYIIRRDGFHLLGNEKVYISY